MRNRITWTDGLLFGSVLVWVLQKLLTTDERPPIRVRGGSVRFENDWGWEMDGGEWKTKGGDARKVKYFTAMVNDKSCGLQRAVQLNITYESATGKQETFKVIHRRGEPRIIPGGLLEQHPFYYDSIVHDGDKGGRLLKISGPPGPHNVCVLPEGAVVRIEYEYH